MVVVVVRICNQLVIVRMVVVGVGEGGGDEDYNGNHNDGYWS